MVPNVTRAKRIPAAKADESANPFFEVVSRQSRDYPLWPQGTAERDLSVVFTECSLVLAIVRGSTTSALPKNPFMRETSRFLQPRMRSSAFMRVQSSRSFSNFLVYHRVYIYHFFSYIEERFLISDEKIIWQLSRFNFLKHQLAL